MVAAVIGGFLPGRRAGMGAGKGWGRQRCMRKGLVCEACVNCRWVPDRSSRAHTLGETGMSVARCRLLNFFLVCLCAASAYTKSLYD